MPFIIQLPGPEEGSTSVFGPYSTREEAQAEADRFLLMVDVPVQHVSVGAMNHPDKLRAVLDGIAADLEEQEDEEDGPWCDDCGDDATTTCPVCQVPLCASCAGDECAGDECAGDEHGPERFGVEVTEVNSDRGPTYCETWVAPIQDPGSYGYFGPTTYAEDQAGPSLPAAIRRALEWGAEYVRIRPYPPHALAGDEWPECIR